MKSIRSFFLGALLGLGLAVALLIGTYLSPMRQPLYFRFDPDVVATRAKLDQYQENFSRDELRIAGEATPPADSLRGAQSRAWKEYLRWRGQMAELAKVHAQATPGGFASWTYSLRMASIPLAAVLALLPGILLALRARRKDSRASAPRRRAPPPRAAPSAAPQEKNDAMKSLEAAIRQVARIADQNAEPETKPLPKIDPRQTVFMPPIETEEESSPYDHVVDPETKPFPIARDPQPESGPPSDGAPSRKKDRDTEFFQLGPGWGDTIRPPEGGADQPPEAAGAAGLSMEDEDADLDDEEQPGAFMPPTTEVERVERRKAEVLKLARKGLTSSEISRRLRMSQDQVEFIIRLRREKG